MGGGTFSLGAGGSWPSWLCFFLYCVLGYPCPGQTHQTSFAVNIKHFASKNVYLTTSIYKYIVAVSCFLQHRMNLVQWLMGSLPLKTHQFGHGTIFSFWRLCDSDSASLLWNPAFCACASPPPVPSKGVFHQRIVTSIHAVQTLLCDYIILGLRWTITIVFQPSYG